MSRAFYLDPVVPLVIGTVFYILFVKLITRWHRKRYPPSVGYIPSEEDIQRDRYWRDRADREFENRERGIIRDSVRSIDRKMTGRR